MFSLELYIIAVFGSFILIDTLGLPQIIKRLFKIKAHKKAPGLDCLPCATFWLSLLTLNIFVAMAAYLTALLIDSIRYRL